MNKIKQQFNNIFKQLKKLLKYDYYAQLLGRQKNKKRINVIKSDTIQLGEWANDNDNTIYADNIQFSNKKEILETIISN